MTAISSSLYPFEQSTTEGDNRAFVIVKAKYNGSTSYSYYKLDLAVANKSTGVVANYDIIRNYWYKITISQVDRVGVAWSEVIKPGRIADNNITASTELDKYPSIAFGTEKLEVSKTTYVFTKSGQSLNMLATYVNTAPTPEKPTGYAGLKLIDGENLSEVVSGSLSMNNENGSGRIAAFVNAPSSEEKIAYFYVKGGDLQRKITLILRKPYVFENVRFYKSNDVEGDNIILYGPDQAINFAFTIPDYVDASIFPLECRIKSTTLYAVTDGVRIETDPENDKMYYYVYTAKNAGRHTVLFKTNASVFGETAGLTAENFEDTSALYVVSEPEWESVRISGKVTGGSSWRGYTVQYIISNRGISGNFKCGSEGSYSIELEKFCLQIRFISIMMDKITGIVKNL